MGEVRSEAEKLMPFFTLFLKRTYRMEKQCMAIQVRF